MAARGDEEIRAQLASARDDEARRSASEPRAVSASYDRDSGRMTIELANGCAFSFPTEMAQGLRGASARDLEEVTIELGGEGLHWERLDADLLVPELLRGVFGSERWMREIGRTLGARTSEAKATAARLNGRKGGRPRKQT